VQFFSTAATIPAIALSVVVIYAIRQGSKRLIIYYLIENLAVYALMYSESSSVSNQSS
jgi:hypothetical protein